jgi:phage-related holin
MSISLFDYFLEKLIITIPACFLTVHMEHREVIVGVLFMFAMDTFLGIAMAIKHRRFQSRSMQRAITKFGVYVFAMLNAWVLSVVFPFWFGWVFSFVGAFIMITEFTSNMETLALFGLKIPQWLISRVNSQFQRLRDSEVTANDIMDARDAHR